MKKASKISFKLDKLQIMSMLCMIFLVVINVAIALIASPDNADNQLVISLCGMFFAGIGYLMSEKALYKSAFPVFCVLLIILISQLTVDSYAVKRWITIGTFSVKTSALLPLLAMAAAKMITLYKQYSMSRVFVIILPIMICLFLVYAQNNIVPVFMGLLVMYVVLEKMKFEKKINNRWIFFGLYVSVVVFVIIFIAKYSEIVEFSSERIRVILTRGKDDPIGSGWTRVFLDGIIKETPLFGTTKYNAELKDVTIYEHLYKMGDHNIVIVLAKLGWIPFVLFILAFISFLSMLFEMIVKTNQSDFAKYTSFILATILVVKTIYCLLGFFVLDCSHNEMPFMSGLSNRWIEFFSFGIILGLYGQRCGTTQTVVLKRQWSLSEELYFYIFETQKDIEPLKNMYKKVISKLDGEHIPQNLQTSNYDTNFEGEKLTQAGNSYRVDHKSNLSSEQIKYAFMSYSSKDKRIADETEKLLKKNGVYVWRDSRGISPGQKYAAVLLRAIKHCSCFVLLLTEDAQRSKWVSKEVERAINYNKPIVTLIVGDFELNEEFEMYISNSHYVNICRVVEHSDEFKSIMNSIKKYTERTE